jgi:large subunit ribosomal protein L4
MQEAIKLNTLDLCQYRRIVVSTKALEKIIARASVANGGN